MVVATALGAVLVQASTLHYTVPGSATPLAQTVPLAGRPIYQQRTSEGRVVLTDRPDPRAVTQRIWRYPAEEASIDRERQEASRLEALAVSERISRQIELDRSRDDELTLARLASPPTAALSEVESEEPSAIVLVRPGGRRLHPSRHPPRADHAGHR